MATNSDHAGASHRAARATVPPDPPCRMTRAAPAIQRQRNTAVDVGHLDLALDYLAESAFLNRRS
jgi:hypothetical protein